MDPVRPRGGEMRADIDNQGRRPFVRPGRQGPLPVHDTPRDRAEAPGPGPAGEPRMSPDTGYALRSDIGHDAREPGGRGRRGEDGRGALEGQGTDGTHRAAGARDTLRGGEGEGSDAVVGGRSIMSGVRSLLEKA